MYKILNETNGEKINNKIFGGKAKGLVQLHEMGFRIPRTVLFTASYINTMIRRNNESVVSIIEKNIPNINGYMVRSSYIDEDDLSFSNAGKYLSVYINDVSELENAILRVLKSAEINSGKMSIIVQEYIKTDYIGVAFSVNPLNDEKEMIIEISEGDFNGDSTAHMNIRRISDKDIMKLNIENTNFTKNIECIFSDIKKISKKLDYPVDVEFAINNDSIIYLQTRPITSYKFQTHLIDDIDDYTGIWIWMSHQGESLTPFTSSYIKAISNKLENISIKTLNNHIYFSWDNFKFQRDLYKDINPYDEWLIKKHEYVKTINKLKKLNCDKLTNLELCENLDRSLKLLMSYLDYYLIKESKAYEGQLFGKIQQVLIKFFDEKEIERNLLNYMMDVETVQTEKATKLCEIASYINENSVTFDCYKEDKGFTNLVEIYLNSYGYDSKFALSLYEPIISDDFQQFIKYLISNSLSFKINERKIIKNEWLEKVDNDNRISLIKDLNILKQLVIKNDDDDDLFLQIKALIRGFLLFINSKYKFEENSIFFYLYDEVKKLVINNKTIDENTLNCRKKEYKKSCNIIMPSRIVNKKVMWWENNAINNNNESCVLGTAVSYGQYMGKITHNITFDKMYTLDIEHSNKMDIVVIKSINPQMFLYLANAKGIIVEFGGVFSHGAILAREFNIPTIIGVDNACSKFECGQEVLIDCENSIIRVIN